MRQPTRPATRLATLVAIATITAAGCATSPPVGEVIRHPLLNSSFPIAAAVEIRGDVSTVHLSGQVPPNLDPAPTGRPAVYGSDTRTQTEGTLRAIDATLHRLGLTMGDVVRMQVFLVGDPVKGGRMDFAGFMEGYTQFFGTPTQPNLPTRSVFQVVGLANPAWFVEIEVTAVRRR